MPGYPYPPDKPRDEDTPADEGTFILKDDLEHLLAGYGNEQYGHTDEDRAVEKRAHAALRQTWR